ILAWLVVGFRRKGKCYAAPTSRRLRSFRYLLGTARWVFVGILACWLGLIVWLAVCPGGPAPPPKTGSAPIRGVTRDNQCGRSEGPPWKQFDWPVRKRALRAALDQIQPDILCVEEATPEQVAFLEETLPGHGRGGIGRDGESAGEHCAIYFDRLRFVEIGGD